MSEKLQKKLAGIVALLLGVILHQVITGPMYQQALSSKKWPVTNARVIKSKVNAKAGQKKNLYQLEFAYTYFVGQREYRGETRYFDFGEGARKWKGDFYTFVDTHPVGSTIEAYYNPKRPEQATILRGLYWWSWLTIGFNCLLFFIGVTLILFPSWWRS